jgi:hypothetical protein
MGEALEAWSGFILVAIFFSSIASVLFIWVGTKTIGIESLTLKKIIIAAILISVFIYIVTLIVSSLPFFGTIISYCIALVLSLFVIQLILSLSIHQSLVLWGFNVAAQILAVLFCAEYFIGGIKNLIKII